MEEKSLKKTWSLVKNWVIPIIIGLLIALLVKTFLISMVKVDGHSMDPTLNSSERVFVLKPEPIKRNSIIVFNAQGVDPKAVGKAFYVKRVIGMPGDRINYHPDGSLYINGKKQQQNYIDSVQSSSGTLKPIAMDKKGFNLKTLSHKSNWKPSTLKVPSHCYFVMGDNRYISNDSRYWGFVPKTKIEGTVKVPFWEK